MKSDIVKIQTNDGVCACELFPAPVEGPRPGVILYTDAIGIRPAWSDPAQKIASHGFDVLVPNLYYRCGPYAPFDVKAVFQGGPERERLMTLFHSLNNAIAMRDTASFLDFFARRPETAGQKIGCVGYCMGGPFALTAAGTYPDRVYAAASLHGSRLANDKPDSPHLLAPKMRGAIYVGVAGIDPLFPDEERLRLDEALKAAHVKYEIEVYPRVRHGFAVPDTPVHNAPAYAHHLEKILKLFAKNLKTGQDAAPLTRSLPDSQ